MEKDAANGSNDYLKRIGYYFFKLNYYLWMLVVMVHQLPASPKISDDLALKCQYITILIGVLLFLYGFVIRLNGSISIWVLFSILLILSLIYNLIKSGGGVIVTFQAVAFFVSAINIPREKILPFLKQDIGIRIFILLFVISTGYSNNNYGVAYAGFVNINPFGIWIIVILVECFFILRNRQIFVWIVISSICITFLGIIGSSRTAIFAFLISVFFTFFFQNKKLNKIIAYLWMIIPCGILLFYKNYNVFSGDFIYNLNQLLSDRIDMGIKIFSQYGIGLWGQRIELVSRSLAAESFGRLQYLVLDNGYLTMLLLVGLVSSILIIFLLIVGSLKLIYVYKKNAVLAIIFFSFLGFSENNVLMIEYNFLFIVMGAVLLRYVDNSNLVE